MIWVQTRIKNEFFMKRLKKTYSLTEINKQIG